MVTDGAPNRVWCSVGVDPVEVVDVAVTGFVDGTGAASGEVELVTAMLRGSRAVRLIRKTFTPLASGPHAEASRRLDHWAYWRRELTAYQSGALPTGPDLRAPRFYGVVDDVLYIEYVGEQQPTAGVAATALGRWHRADHLADHLDKHPWLARHQLAQRIAVSDLDWSAVDLDRRLRGIWDRRGRHLDDLRALPWSITHGDFSTGNLRVDGEGIVALDWATVGVSPVGFDIAHLALATLDESLFTRYVDGLSGRFDVEAVRVGYRVSVGLVGASRAHWMASRSIPLPLGYIDFVSANAPA